MKKRINGIIILIVCLSIITGFSFALPEIEVPESSVIYDVNGEIIKGLAEQNRINVELNEIAPDFLNALIAVEDKNFYQHHGIDVRGILRATWINIKNRKIVEGGSTLTQQTVKKIFLSDERTFIRKIKEVIYAVQLERKYSKDEILQMYCNTVYFGHGAYGVEVASRTYFTKSAGDLTLAEAALLAGLPQSPSYYDPYVNPEAAKKRQEIVLERMLAEKIITEKQKKQAEEVKLNYQGSSFISGEAPYFVAMIKEYLLERFGEDMVYQGGMKVYTTLNLAMQRAANQAAEKQMSQQDTQLQLALVALDNANGQIRAIVGGRNFNQSSYNRVYANRQPGSTFKPFMYSLAIADGWTAAGMMSCEKIEYTLPDGQIYTPTDYGNEPYHWKKFTLKEALMRSDNVIAVAMNANLDPKRTATYAEKFGFKNILPVLSLPLGSNEVRPIDMAAAYSVFANGGIFSEPNYILKITDKKGKTLIENTANQYRVINADNAYVITNMLSGVLEPGGTASHLKNTIGRTAAVKTGTTDDYKDAWMVGYTPELCCAVWVGYDKGKSVNMAGGVIAGPILAQFFRDALVNTYPVDFRQPENIDLINICLDSGLLAGEKCERTSTMAFIKGTEPEDICWEHNSIFPTELSELWKLKSKFTD